MKKENVIKSCYSVLRKCTPLDYDCGRLCDGFCCKGGNELGMLLFPGEEKLIDPDIKVTKTESGDIVAVCGGRCDRNKRPLACRIYPVFPIIKEFEGREYVENELDVRANCPLVEGQYPITRRFDKAVRRAGKYLLLNEETAHFYRKLSAEIQEYSELKKILKK